MKPSTHENVEANAAARTTGSRLAAAPLPLDDYREHRAAELTVVIVPTLPEPSQLTAEGVAVYWITSNDNAVISWDITGKVAMHHNVCSVDSYWSTRYLAHDGAESRRQLSCLGAAEAVSTWSRRSLVRLTEVEATGPSSQSI